MVWQYAHNLQGAQCSVQHCKEIVMVWYYSLEQLASLLVTAGCYNIQQLDRQQKIHLLLTETRMP